MPAGPDAAQAHRAFGIGQFAQDALAILKKGSALEGQRNSPRGAQQKLDAEALFQRVQPPADNRRGDALGTRRGRHIAATCDPDEGRNLLELVHSIL